MLDGRIQGWKRGVAVCGAAAAVALAPRAAALAGAPAPPAAPAASVVLDVPAGTSLNIVGETFLFDGARQEATVTGNAVLTLGNGVRLQVREVPVRVQFQGRNGPYRILIDPPAAAK